VRTVLGLSSSSRAARQCILRFVRRFDHLAVPAGWHEKPSWFVVTGRDRMIDSRLQYVMANHVVMLSQPKVVADAIIAAARKVQ
jgi:hypothetical protein